MNTTNVAVATGAVVIAGRWSQSQNIELPVVIGATVYAVALSILADANEKFAGQFGLLVLVAALMRYTLPIAFGTGLLKKAPATPKTGG